MPFAFEFSVDFETASRIETLRTTLRNEGIRGLDFSYPFHPHVTLGYFDDIPEHELTEIAVPLAITLAPQPLVLSTVGMFVKNGAAILFLGVTPNENLLSANQIVHRAVEGRAQPCGPYCLPGNLVPHLSLGDNVPFADISRALGIIEQSHLLPIQARSDTLLADCDGRIVQAFPLQGVRTPSLSLEPARPHSMSP